MRIRTLKVIISGLFCLTIIALFYVQIVNAPLYIKLSRNNRIRIVPIVASRGDIFDREGRTLVSNRASFNCVGIPQELDDKEKTLSKVSRILGIEKAVLKRRFRKGTVSPFTPVIIAKDISKENAIAIEEERLNLPGIFIYTKPVRDYRYRDAYAHLVGYIGEIAPDELDRLDRYGYRMNDLIGKAGIEKKYDNYLKGKNGGMQIEVDNKGRQVRVLSSKEPERGKDIYLTIDIELQEYIDEIFKNKKGACVVMDPRNGEVLSFISRPSFDPNLFAGSDARIKRILKDPCHPMLNRAISCAYPPGSSFKIVVATAALEERKINTSKSFVCSGTLKIGGRIFHCWRKKGHGPQNVINGLKNSCNIFFYNTGLLIGPDTISRYAQRFGFGRPTGIDLPGEIGGLVPGRIWKRLKIGKKWYNGETANYAIGQGYLLVTPIQILRMVSVVASEGFLIEPHVVKKIESVEVAAEVRRKVGISKKTIENVTIGLRKVVEDDNGTGVRARIEGATIAGKTGTAQTGRGTTHAWFAGFSPTEKPKLALVVFLEEGGKGGLNAAVAAGKIFEKAKELNLL